MGTSIAITFRESLEISLLVIPILVYLKKVNKRNLSRYLIYGILAGFLSSLAIGGTLFSILTTFSPSLQELFVGFLSLVISTLILYNIITINKQKFLTDIDSYSNSISPSVLFLLSFITVFRECLEIILFTLPTLLVSIGTVLTGVFIGILLTLIASVVIYYTSNKININAIFMIITGMLIYFGALMFGEALASFMPSYGEDLVTVGALMYGIPTALLYIKKHLKALLKKLK